MLAFLCGLLLLVLGGLFEYASSRHHRVFSALSGAAVFAIIAFFLTAKLTGGLKVLCILLAAVAGGALFSWLLVTGIFFGAVLYTVVLAYAFVFILPLPIQTLYYGYAALFLGICAVWKKHLAAQVLECLYTGLLAACGIGFLVSCSFERFFSWLSYPKEHLAALSALYLVSFAVAAICGILRKKTNRLEEVK